MEKFTIFYLLTKMRNKTKFNILWKKKSYKYKNEGERRLVLADEIIFKSNK